MKNKRKSNLEWFADEKGLYGENYWKFVGKDAFEKTDEEIKFLKRELALKPGRKILDVACGHGRALDWACKARV